MLEKQRRTVEERRRYEMSLLLLFLFFLTFLARNSNGSSSPYRLLAANARQLGSALLTRTMENRPELGMDSYDRLCPSQDTLPKSGFGNLIALPLQKRPRDQGNSVFLDDLFQPHVDQWKFLESVQRIPLGRLAQ